MKKFMVSALIICLLILGYYVYFESYKNETNPDDIFIEATLKHNENPRMDHKDVMLEVLIDKKKYSQHMIYPYIPGLQNMSFDNREEKGFFVPTSIGSGPNDEQRVYDTLINQMIIDDTVEKDQLHFIGFWSPQEAGIHKMRLYFQTEDFESNNEMYLIYVHKEEGIFRQDLGWTKLVRIKSEL